MKHAQLSRLFTALVLTASACVDDDDAAPLDEVATAATESELSTATAIHWLARVANGSLQVRSTDVAAGPWATITTGVAGVRIASDRIVIRKTDSSVWAKEAAITSGAFVQIAPPGAALEIAAAGRLIALRSATGKIQIKDGALTTPWVDYVASGAKAVAVAGCGAAYHLTSPASALSACWATSRVGYIDAAGVFRVRTPGGPWSTIAGNVTAIAMHGAATGYRTTAGAFMYNDGDGWKTAATNVAGIALARDEVAFTTASPTAGSLYTRSTSNLGTVFAKAPVLQLANVVGIAAAENLFAARLGTGALLSNTSPETQFGTPWRAEGAGTQLMPSRACSVANSGGEGYFVTCF